jgi:hypothetical protein
MQSTGLTFTWDSTKLMSNSAFAIVHLNYNQNAGITNIQQTQFEIIIGDKWIHSFSDLA